MIKTFSLNSHINSCTSSMIQQCLKVLENEIRQEKLNDQYRLENIKTQFIFADDEFEYLRNPRHHRKTLLEFGEKFSEAAEHS